MKEGAVFYKMTGSGNDFLIFDGRYSRLDDFTPEAVRRLCERRTGIGADGVILLGDHAPAGAHFTFHFWNSDGTEGPMCGNGALCATRLATMIELAPAEAEVRFVTAAGLHTGRVTAGRPTIGLPDCEQPRRLPDAALESTEVSPAWLGRPSVPHLVLRTDDLERIELERRGPALRNDPATGPGGANVNWLAPAGDGSWRMRTYERGVEGETLACGTGAVACAMVLEAEGLARPPVRIWTRSGLPLDVDWALSGSTAHRLTLTGEGRLVFRGVVGELVTP